MPGLMKSVARSLGCAFVLVTGVLATPSIAAPAPAVSAVPPHPVWRVVSYRAKEEKKDLYLRFLDRVYRLKLEAWKAAGLITDYKILTVDPAQPGDPDVIFMFEYRDMAALDIPDAVWAQVGAKAVEPLKDDKEAQQWSAEFPEWRSLVGYAPLAREIIGR